MELDCQLDNLFDPGSFTPFEPMSGTVIATGQGQIDGRRVLAVIEHVPLVGTADTEVISRSLRKFHVLIEHALKAESPVVLLIDAAGRSSDQTLIPPNAASLLTSPDGVGRTYALLGRLSGRVPIVTAVMGQAAATLSFQIALSDAQVFTRNAGMCIGRPDAVSSMIGEQVEYETLGGASLHYHTSGSCDAVVDDPPLALRWVRQYLSYMPTHYKGLPPEGEPGPVTTDRINTSWLKQHPNRPVNMRLFVTSLTDPASMLELRAGWATELCTALARVQGRVVGIVANDSSQKGGIFFPDTCLKASRFISLCDAFNIPLAFLADTPGFMVGSAAEKKGVVKAAAQLFSTPGPRSGAHAVYRGPKGPYRGTVRYGRPRL